jgi:putative membrane protein
MAFTPPYAWSGSFYILLCPWQVSALIDIVNAILLCYGQVIMVGLLLHWVISALSLMIVAYIFPGIQLQGLGAALIAPIVIGLINATIGLILKIITFPLTILTLGIFWLIINALMLQLAAALVPGFYVAGFLSAFFGAIVLSIVSMILRSFIA